MLNLVKLKENNEINIVNHIHTFKDPAYIYIPILKGQTFKVNDYIYKNECIDSFFSSISGNIKNSKKVLYKKGLVYAIEIENDYKENSKTKRTKNKTSNKEDLINALQSYYQDNILNKIKNIKEIKNLVISSIDEEEYSLNEFLRLTNNYIEILDTIDVLLNIFNIDKASLAMKSTNYKSIKNVKSISGSYPNIDINLVPDKYLISYKDFLCKYLNLEKENTLVLKTNEVYNIYSILKNTDISEKLITISGNAIEKSLIINTRLYTSLNELLDKFIKIKDFEYDVYINGYLNGKKYNNLDDIIITGDIDTIVINKREMKEQIDCINCGACMKICPQKINVLKCFNNLTSHKKCIGCGSCNYVCPANIKLKEIVMSDDNEKL